METCNRIVNHFIVNHILACHNQRDFPTTKLWPVKLLSGYIWKTTSYSVWWAKKLMSSLDRNIHNIVKCWLLAISLRQCECRQETTGRGVGGVEIRKCHKPDWKPGCLHISVTVQNIGTQALTSRQCLRCQKCILSVSTWLLGCKYLCFVAIRIYMNQCKQSHQFFTNHNMSAFSNIEVS